MIIEIKNSTNIQKAVLENHIQPLVLDYLSIIQIEFNSTDFVLSLNNQLIKKVELPFRIGSLLNLLIGEDGKISAQNTMKKIEFGDYSLDINQFLFTNKNSKQEIYLTEKETALIAYLYKAKQSVSRNQLLQDIWEYVEGVETHTLETHLYRLRQKLEKEFGLTDFIVAGENGYYLKIL